MSIKPDLGLRLIDEGVSSKDLLVYYDVPFDRIDVLSPDTFSTMLEIGHGGEVHAVSFDFDAKFFGEILGRLDAQERQRLGESLDRRQCPFSFNLPRTITARILEASLRSLQTGAHDSFVPLRITRVEW